MADDLATTSVNPYLAYNFRVKWDGRYVAAVTNVSGLRRGTALTRFHVGDEPQSAFKIPGQSDYEPIRLERGITMDAAFQQWTELIWWLPNTGQLGRETSLADFRKDIQIDLYDAAGQIALRYNIYHCWPSECTALPELHSEANTVALASLTLEHEGWDRDTSVTLPSS